jgi:hypothetical protein
MSESNKRKRRPREDNLIHRIVQIVTRIPSVKSVDKLRNLLQIASTHDDIWASLTLEKLVKVRRYGGWMTLHDYCLASYLYTFALVLRAAGLSSCENPHDALAPYSLPRCWPRSFVDAYQAIVQKDVLLRRHLLLALV